MASTQPILDLSQGLIQYGGKPCVVYLFGPDKQEWFDCRCIAEILEISQLPTAMQRVDSASKSYLSDLVGRLGQPERIGMLRELTQHDRRSWVVDEAGFYELAMGSRKSNAVAFRRWVCREVLPVIRRARQFDAVQHVLDMTRSKQADRAGVIYAITSPYMNVIKLGRWTGSTENLRKRYRTYYGGALELHLANVEDCCTAEREMLTAFQAEKASGELFRKEALTAVLGWMSTYTNRCSLKRRAEDNEDHFAKKLAVRKLAVQEMQTTTGAVQLLLERGDGERDRVWGLHALKNAVITKDKRIDDFEGIPSLSALTEPKRVYLFEVALAMGYDRKTIQPALARIGMQVRRQWNEDNPEKATEGPPKRTVVYNNKTRKENVCYESDRTTVEQGIRVALGDMDDVDET